MNRRVLASIFFLALSGCLGVDRPHDSLNADGGRTFDAPAPSRDLPDAAAACGGSGTSTACECVLDEAVLDGCNLR